MAQIPPELMTSSTSDNEVGNGQPIIANEEQRIGRNPATTHWLIIFVVLYGIVLYSVVGYSIYKKNNAITKTPTIQTPNTPPQLQLPQYNEMSENASSGSFGFISTKILTDLPIVELRPFESSKESTASEYPTNLTVKLSIDILNKVSAYRLGNFVFIGPKNWIGGGYIDIYGTSARLYPNNTMDGNGPYIKAYSAPINKNSLMVGSQFFQWIRDNAQELQIEQDLQPIPKVSSISAMSKHLIFFSDNTAFGSAFELYGMAFSNADTHLQDKSGSTMVMEINMNKEDRQFAQEIINTFIEQYDLKNK